MPGAPFANTAGWPRWPQTGQSGRAHLCSSGARRRAAAAGYSGLPIFAETAMASPQPVERGDYEGVTFLQRRESLIQSGAVGLGALTLRSECRSSRRSAARMFVSWPGVDILAYPISSP